MPRGSSFTSVLTFFREGNEDEVRAILPLVIEAAGQRHITINAGPAPRPQRTVKRRGGTSASAKKAWATRHANAQHKGDGDPRDAKTAAAGAE